MGEFLRDLAAVDALPARASGVTHRKWGGGYRAEIRRFASDMEPPVTRRLEGPRQLGTGL